MRLKDVQSDEDWKQMYAERGETIKQVLAEKRARGETTGRLPIGYRQAWSVDIGKHIEIDPVTAPLITKAFVMAATGKHSISQIATRLHVLGLAAANGKLLASATLHGILHNLTYVSGIDGAEPLTDPETFYRVQGVLAVRTKKRLDAF